MKTGIQCKPFGKQAILIEWPSKIAMAILREMIAFKETVLRHSNGKIIDVVLGYHSITLKYSEEITDFSKEVLRLKKYYQESNEKIPAFTGMTSPTNYTWEIPVCYDTSFGVDLPMMAKEKNLSISEIIALHTQPVYTVYFIGFLPGFLYLGGLHSQLETPRHSTPRFTVEKGTVGIGGAQTGIYPSESAGGWNLIGKTPISFFDVNAASPCFAKSGDGIQFVAVSLEKYVEIEKEMAQHRYIIQKRRCND